MTFIRETGKILTNSYIIDAQSWGIKYQNAVYFIMDKKNVLIDTGTSSDTRKINNYIKNNLHCSSIDYIIITHNHLDHSGGLRYFLKKYNNIKIILSEKSKVLIEDINNLIKNKEYKSQIITVKEGDKLTLNLDHELQILDTPGHAPDHISILDLKNKFIFVGDSAGAYHIGKNFCRPTAYAPDFEYIKYLKTLKRFIAMDINGIGIASYGFVMGYQCKKLLKFGLDIFIQWFNLVKKYYNEGLEIDEISTKILKKFGRSPGEIKENRPESWIKQFLFASIQGFIGSIKKNSDEKKI